MMSKSKKKKIKKKTSVNKKNKAIKPQKNTANLKNNKDNNTKINIIKKLKQIKNSFIRLFLKFKNKKIKLWVFIMNVSLIIFITVLILLNKKDSSIFNEIDASMYLDLINSKEVSYIYVKDKDCAYCEMVEPYLNKLSTEYSVVINLLDVSALNNEQIEMISYDKDTFDGIYPKVLFKKNENEVLRASGYNEYSTYKKYIEKVINTSNQETFININVDKYLSLFNSSNISIVYIGRENDKYCKKYSEILESVMLDKKIDIFYLDTDSLITSSEWDKLNNSSDIFNKFWFIPATIIIKDNKIKDYKFEFMEKEELIEFMNKNGV